MMTGSRNSVLVVDDTAELRELLAMRVQGLGYEVATASDGREALDILRSQPFDLVLLDIMMPEVNGYQVLEVMRDDPQLSQISVIVISALHEMDTIVKCIELGAEDYLPKPFKPALLRSRVEACLERKNLRAQHQVLLQAITQEKQNVERLLLNILPASIAGRLQAGEKVIVDDCQAVTVLLVDIADFTRQASQLSPQQLVITLGEIFSFFEQVANTYGLEKVKIFGDAYMLASGLPASRERHVEAAVEAALAMQREAGRFQLLPGYPLTLRIGIHSGPVVAGVVGVQKFSYELWGDTVLTTRNMLAHCPPGEIQASSKIYGLLQDEFQFEPSGDVPGGTAGAEKAYLLRGRKA